MVALRYFDLELASDGAFKSEIEVWLPLSQDAAAYPLTTGPSNLDWRIL